MPENDVVKRVLIAPLHWGLGHATRCVPLIQDELDQGNEVWIAASGGPRAFLADRFPEAVFVDIPFMEITYPKDGNMARHFFWRGPQFLWSIWKEHRILQKLCNAHAFDQVISDARFGLWTKSCRCVFVTHQVHIISPVAERMINWLHRWVMRRYDEVWIPDYAQNPGLAGVLSHPKHLPKHARYIGPLSRFRKQSLPRLPRMWDVLAIISGPEPQRSLFAAAVARTAIENDLRTLIVEGKPGSDESSEVGKIRRVAHLEDAALIEAIAQSETIVSRSGYSSIMDYHALGVEAVLVPTPGQTEQEYLARLHRPSKEVTLKMAALFG